MGQVVRRLVIALGPDAEPPPDQLPKLLLVVTVQLPRREQALGVGHDLARLRAAVGLVGGDQAAAVMPGGVRKRLSPRRRIGSKQEQQQDKSEEGERARKEGRRRTLWKILLSYMTTVPALQGNLTKDGAALPGMPSAPIDSWSSSWLQCGLHANCTRWLPGRTAAHPPSAGTSKKKVKALSVSECIGLMLI